MELILPSLIVIGMESNLFQGFGMIGRPAALPYTLTEQGKIMDNEEIFVEYFPQVPSVLELLRDRRINVVLYCDPERMEAAKQLVELLDWTRYFAYKIPYPKEDNDHLKNVHNITNIPYSQMVYFSNLPSIVNTTKDLGALSIYVQPKSGLTLKVYSDALKAFHIRNQNTTIDLTNKFII